MVYHQLYRNHIYGIKVTRTDNKSNNIRYAYAWSQPNLQKKIGFMRVTGDRIVGKALTAHAVCSDYTTVIPEFVLTYQWKRSTDNQNWISIPEAMDSSYVLQEDDAQKYIMCVITPKSDSIISSEPESESINNVVLLYGDADSDGSVTILDATRLQRYLAGLATLTADEIIAGDVDGDSSITIADATLIQNYVLGIIHSFPVETDA